MRFPAKPDSKSLKVLKNLVVHAEQLADRLVREVLDNVMSTFA